MSDSRAEFEKWISEPPYEREPRRFPSFHPEWPGSYESIDIDLAWQAWKAAISKSNAP